MPRHNGHTSKHHKHSTKVSKAHASSGYGLKVILRESGEVDLKILAESMGVTYR